MLRKSHPMALTTLLVLQLAVWPARAQENQDKPNPPPLGTASYTPAPSVKEQPLTSQTFAVQAAVINLAEIELGQLALQKSANPGTQQFAKRLIRDHQAAHGKLKAVAAEEKISLPATVDEEHRALKQKLSQLADAAFDRQYIDAMTQGHAKAIALFEAAASSPQVSASLRSYANAILPTLKEHSEAAHALHEKESNQ